MTTDGAPSPESPWPAILEAARWYPSPHNSQPITARITGDRTAALYYDLDKGLPAEDFGIPFGYVCMGVFWEYLEVVAAAHGFTARIDLRLTELDFAATERQHPFAEVDLEPQPVTAGARSAYMVLRRRRTSRRPYDSSLVDPRVIAGAAEIAAAFGHRFTSRSDPHVVDRIIAVNAETLFDDLSRDAVYAELMQWLRFSKAEARAKADGLSAETMLLPGPVLRLAMSRRGIWEAPVVGPVLRWFYLRTMTGVRQVGWLEGPFATPEDYVTAGRCFLRVWRHFTAHDVYLHPYGTVITNPRSHAELVRLAEITEVAPEMAWMLFRFGHSQPPPPSYRRPVAAMLLPTSPNT